MKIKILTLGKIRQKFIQEGEAEYVKRLNKRAKIEIVELDVEKFSNLPIQSQIEKEAEIFLSKIGPRDFLIALDQGGKSLDSLSFAELLKTRMNSGISSFVFGIGGSHGFEKQVLKKAGFTLSLSQLTFTYQLTGLILSEQLYRAFSIIDGTAYHK